MIGSVSELTIRVLHGDSDSFVHVVAKGVLAIGCVFGRVVADWNHVRVELGRRAENDAFNPGGDPLAMRGSSCLDFSGGT
jgi:hypothetical protein